MRFREIAEISKLAIVGMWLGCSGCGQDNETAYQKAVWVSYQARLGSLNLVANVVPTSSHNGPGIYALRVSRLHEDPHSPDNSQLLTRLQNVTELQCRLALATSRYDNRTTYLQTQAGQLAEYQSFLSVASAISAVTSIALTTASPANRVLAVIFTGLAGTAGSNGGQGILSAAQPTDKAENILSNLVNVQAIWKVDSKAANEDIAALPDLVNDVSANGKWPDAIKAAAGAVTDVENDAMLLGLPSLDLGKAGVQPAGITTPAKPGP